MNLVELDATKSIRATYSNGSPDNVDGTLS